MKNYKIAIVGRPNVGKSALFNRLIKQRKSIVEEKEGITRDRIYADLEWQGYCAQIIDTGGFVTFSEYSRSLKKIEKAIKRQIDIAIEESKLSILVTDVRTGLTSLDREVFLYLKKRGKDIILAVNKVDNERLKTEVGNFYQLGFEKLFPVSAIQGLGISELLDYIVKKLPPFLSFPRKEGTINIAVVGKPNAGKSSFINSLLKQERVIVNEEPGTTIDTVDISFNRGERKYLFLDTAGIRKKRAIKDSVTLYSLLRTKRAIEKAEVVLLLIDIREGLTSQDIAILHFVIKENKPCLIGVNKKDLLGNIPLKEYEQAIRGRIKYLHFAPIIFLSALKGNNVKETIDLIDEIADNNSRRVATNLLNKMLFPSFPFRVYYLTQIRIKPPEFLVFVDKPDFVKNNHSVYFKNQIRKKFDFRGVPIEIKFKNKD